ncbi:MAG: aldo/keto reductase, partial [Clostridium celatum]|nr:aldo/keto reductase [Clostridium celatum]
MNEEFRVLSNGVKMPSIGFGTYKSGSDEETAKIIKYALETGYRQIDTASFYGNEVGIGNGIKQSNIKREEIFLVTKLWNDDHGYKKTIEAFNKSLERLQVEYIDLYLIHWPNKLNAETWRAFE